MATFVPPKRATAFTFYVSLVQQASPKLFQVNPTLAAGDVKVSIDGGAEANITTLPVVTPAGSRRVKVDLSVAEMTGDNIQVTFSDAAGAEWCDLTVNIQTTARQVDDLAYPATSGRSLQVETDGMVHADLKEWLATAPLALSSQRVQALVGAITAGVIDAAAIGTGAIDADAIAAGAITSSEAPALANLDVAVSSRGTANPGDLMNLANDAITAAKIAAGAITSSEAPALANLDAAVSTRSSHTAADVWAVGARTLTSFGTLVSDVATAVWAAGTRTLTGFGTLISDIWNNATRTLTASLDPTAVQIRTEIDSNSTQLAAIKAKTDNLPSGIKRNTALAKFSFLMLDSADHVTPKTGLTGFTALRSLDGAAFAACANAVSELANGVYLIDLAAGDLDGAVVTLRFFATGGDPCILTVITEP